MPPSPTPQVASDATAYQGHCYDFGGAQNKGNGCWDCSSFCNWVVGHDLGGAIPGFAAGAYDGRTHGPATTSWLVTNLCSTISVGKLGSAQPGDLLVWQTHMGVYLGNGQMVSALNPNLGTRITTVADGSPGGELMLVRRYNKPLGATAVTTSAGGIPNPLSWVGNQVESDIASAIGPAIGSVFSGIGNNILSIFGVKDVKDLFIRGGLLLFGLVILILGIHAAFGRSPRETTGTLLETGGVAAGNGVAEDVGKDVQKRGAMYAAARESGRRREEAAELRAKGASDLATAQRPQGKPTHPGRKTGSIRAVDIGSVPTPRQEGESSRQRAARYAGTSNAGKSTEEIPF